MSHPSNEVEISSPPGAVAGMGSTPSTTPVTEIPKKGRRSTLTPQEKVEKVTSVVKELNEEAKKKVTEEQRLRYF